jgi:hypothetical protein
MDAGRVTLPAGFNQERTRLTLRLLHAGSYLEEGFPRWELSRRKAVHEVGEGVLMPVGLTLVALWDERGERYVALSRPFEVRRRETVPAPLEVPSANTSQLVAQIQRVALARDADDAKIRIMLGRGVRARAPDVQVSAADRSYAIWYDLPPGRAELRAETRDEVLQPLTVSLASGKIERIFGEMMRPPAWAQVPQR